MKKIYFLTGPKNSGKSTRLMLWAQKQNNIAGVICPRDKGKRELYSILSKSFKEFEVENDNRQVVKIGRFKFLTESFDWAENEILKNLNKKLNWIVIDEIGPLELQGKGFDKIVKSLLANRELDKVNFLFVVRTGLLDDVIHYYHLDKKEVKIVDFI